MGRALALAAIFSTLGAVALAAARSDLRPEFEKAECSSGTFRIDALTGPTGAQRDDNPSARALRKLIRDPESNVYIEGRVPKKRWRLLRRDQRFAIYGSGDADRITTLSLKKTKRDRWAFRNLDSHCRPRVLRDGLDATEWRLDPEAAPPTPTSTTVDILVEESYCNSGDPPEPERILEPTVRYGAKRVTVTYFLGHPDRFETCPSSPPARWRLALSEAVGERTLRDGGTVVAKQRFPKP